MKFKRLMILAIFLIAILSIGAASAVNQTDDSLNYDENDSMDSSNDDVLKSDSNSDILNSIATVTSENFFDYFD